MRTVACGCRTAPGLGVELDREKLAHYHAVYEKEGGISEFYDPARPDWVLGAAAVLSVCL